MTSVEKRRSGRKSGGHRKHSDGGYSDTSSGGSFLDENDREVSNLTDRAFRSLCIGDEAVYNDSDLGVSSPCTQRDRQLAFSQSGQDRDREDREREDLKRAAHENFSLKVQQYSQDCIHGGMYGGEIHRDPRWEVYGERTQGRISATFQHSFMGTSQQEKSLREEQLSFLSNGATELRSQQHRSRSRVSSLIRAFNSEGHKDGTGIDERLREWSDETSWDKSALMSIQRELSEFSAPYQQNFHSGHFASSGPFLYRDTNFYSSGSEIAAVSHSSTSSFMRSSHNKHSMFTQVNCNSNVFIHSEFSPFKVWRDHNRFPFQQDVSGFMHCSEFPKWYETPMYKEPSQMDPPQAHYTAIRHPRNNLAPMISPTLPRSTSTSTMLQKASAVEKRCESELAGHYPHRKRTLGLGTNRLPSHRPSTASPTIEMSRRVRDTISSVKALQQKIKMMTEQNITTGVTESQQAALCSNENLSLMGGNAVTETANAVGSKTSTTSFNISQLYTPLVHAHQEADSSDFQQYAASPQPVEHPPVRAESRGATPDVRMSSYKSRATSLLFNLKDNRKRVKSTYSPTKFKALETAEKSKQPSVKEPKETVIDIPDFPDSEIQSAQQEESSRTSAAVNQYHNPGLSLTMSTSQPAMAYTSQYPEYTLSDCQTAQMQGQMFHHSGLTGFLPENYTGNKLANGQNLHEDLASFAPYKQNMMDDVSTIGVNLYTHKPSYSATETPRQNADNSQSGGYLISKPNTEQPFNETVGRLFTKVEKFEQLKHNKHDYNNVSLQDMWKHTNSPDSEKLSLKETLSPWKQETATLMEKTRQENQSNMDTELEKAELKESFGFCPSDKKPGLVSNNILNQSFSNDTAKNPAYYGQQQPLAVKDKNMPQKASRQNEEDEMKDNHFKQNYNRYNDHEYRSHQMFSSTKDEHMAMNETAQRQYMQITKAHEVHSFQLTEAKPQSEYNIQKNSFNPDNTSTPKMAEQIKNREFVEVKAEPVRAEHIKSQHTQAGVAKVQQWAQVEQPKAESSRLILAGQYDPEEVRTEQAKSGLTKQERVEQAQAEHNKEEKMKGEQTGQYREKQPEVREEQTKAEQTRLHKVGDEPRNITEEAGAEHIKKEQGKQVKAEQAETEKLKEEHIKNKLAKIEQTWQAKIEEAKAEQATEKKINAVRLQEAQVTNKQVQKEQTEGEKLETEKVNSEQAEAESRKVETTKTEQVKEPPPEVKEVKTQVVEVGKVQTDIKVEAETSVHVGWVNTEQSTTEISTTEDAKPEERKAQWKKLERAKAEPIKTENMQERSAKLTAKLAATQQVKTDPDKVEQVKTELAKAKAELAKIKEKMRGDQKEKVRHTVVIKEDDTAKNNVPLKVDMNKNEDYLKQDKKVQLQQQNEDTVIRKSSDQTDKGADDYERLREKYGFTNVISANRNKASVTGNVSSRDANETQVEKVNKEKSKHENSPANRFTTANKENIEEVCGFKSSEVPESQYVYSELSKEFKLCSTNYSPANVNKRANGDSVTDKVRDGSVEKLEKCDPVKDTEVSQQRDSDLAKLLSHERKPKSAEQNVGPGKDQPFIPPRSLSHKDRTMTKQEILTSRIKAHAEKEISAIKEKGCAISKSSTRQLVGSQAVNICQRPPSQEVSKKHESTMPSNITPKHQMEASSAQMEPVKSASTPSSATIPVKSAAITTHNITRTAESLLQNQKQEAQPKQNKEQACMITQGQQKADHAEINGKQKNELKDYPAINTDNLNKNEEDAAHTTRVEAASSKLVTKEKAESKEAAHIDSAPSLNCVFGQREAPVDDDSLQIMGIMVTVRERKPTVSIGQGNNSTQNQMNATEKESNKHHPNTGLELSERNTSSNEVIVRAKDIRETEDQAKVIKLYSENVQEMPTSEIRKNNMTGKRTDPQQESSTINVKPKGEAQLETLTEKGVLFTVTVPAKNKVLSETVPLLYEEEIIARESKDYIDKTQRENTDEEKNPQKIQTEHISENFITKMANTAINNKNDAETLTKQVAQQSMNEDMAHVFNQSKISNMDGKIAPLLDENKHDFSGPKTLNTGPSSKLTQNENGHVSHKPKYEKKIIETDKEDNNVHIDSIAIRVVPAVTKKDIMETVEKQHSTTLLSGMVQANEQKQVASSSCKENTNISNTEEQTKDFTQASSKKYSFEDKLGVQHVMSDVPKLSDSLKISNQQNIKNTTQSENEELEKVNECGESVGESSIQPMEGDYFQVQGVRETSKQLHNNSITDRDASKERGFPGLPPNKTAVSDESYKTGKNEVFVFTVDQVKRKTVDSSTVSIQDENAKRKNWEGEAKMASKQTDGSRERWSINEKIEEDQANHMRKHTEKPFTLSAMERQSSRNSRPTRESMVKEQTEVKPKPKEKVSTVPEISAIADYARLKVIVSEDKEVNTIQEFPPNKKEGFFPLIQTRHSRRPVFTADPQELSVIEKSLPNKTEMSAKLNKEPKALVFPITDKEHQRTGMFKLGDKERQDAKLNEGVLENAVKYTHHKEKNKSPKTHTVHMSEAGSQRGSQDDQSINQSNNHSLQAATSFSVVKNSLPHPTMGQMHNRKENMTLGRNSERAEKQQDKDTGAKTEDGRTAKLKEEKLGIQHEETRSNQQGRKKQLEEECAFRCEEEKREDDTIIKHILEESRASLAEEERRATQREEERRAREREAVAIKIKERREKQKEAEEERKTKQKEDDIRAKQREEDIGIKEIEEKKRINKGVKMRVAQEEQQRAAQEEQQRAKQEEQQRRPAQGKLQRVAQTELQKVSQTEQQGRAEKDKLQNRAVHEELQKKRPVEEEQQIRTAQEELQKRAVQEAQQMRVAQAELQKVSQAEQQSRAAQEKQQKRDAQEEQQRRIAQAQQQTASQEKLQRNTEEELPKVSQGEKPMRATQELQQNRAAQEELQKRASLERQQRRAEHEEEQSRATQEEQHRTTKKEQQRRDLNEKQQIAAQEEQHRRAVQDELQKRAAQDELQRRVTQEEQQKRVATEERQRRATKEEQQVRAAQEQQRRAVQAQLQRKAAQEELQRSAQAEEQQQRRAAQEERQTRAAQEAQQRAAQEEQQKRAGQEQQKRAAQEEQQGKAAQEELRRRAAQELQKRVAQEEQQRRAAQEEQQSRVAQEELQRRAAQELQKRAAQEGQQKRAAQEEQRRRTAQEELQRKAAQELQKRVAQEEQQRRAAQEEQQSRVAQEEQQSRVAQEEQQSRVAQEEQQRRAVQEEQQSRAAQEELQRRAAQELQKRAAQEEQQKRAAQEQQRRQAAQEELQRRVAQEELQRRVAQEQQQKRAAQVDQQRSVQEEQQRRVAQEEQQRRAAQEKQQRRAAQEEQQRRAVQEEQQRRATQEEQERRTAQRDQQRRAAQEEEQNKRAAVTEEQVQIEEKTVVDIEEEKKRKHREKEKALHMSEEERVKHIQTEEQKIQRQKKQEWMRVERGVEETSAVEKEKIIKQREEKHDRERPILLKETHAALKEEKRVPKEYMLTQSYDEIQAKKREEEKLAADEEKVKDTHMEKLKRVAQMDPLQYYAITSTESERKPGEMQICSPLPLQQKNTLSELESNDDSASHMKSYRPHAPASPAPPLPRSSTSSPALGPKPLMFRVKDNTFRGSSFTKSVKPRFHKSLGDDFWMGSSNDRGSERGEEEQEKIRCSTVTPVHPEIGLNRLAAISESSTSQSVSSSQDYSATTPHHRPYSRRSIAMDDDDSRSLISNMSEDLESFASNTTDLADIRGLYDRERPESACSFSSDVSRSLGKPPAVPPKSEKALRRAQRLTTRRMKKELSKAAAESPAGAEKEVSTNRSFSSTEVRSSNCHAVASPHFSSPVSLANAPVLGSGLSSSHNEHQSAHHSFQASPHATGPISVPHSTAAISLPAVSPHATGPASHSAAPKTVAHIPSSPTLHHANHPVTQYHVESSYHPAYPLTQRKVLQDPSSGQYFVVDLPVPVKKKTFFDPETGKYIQLNVRESGQSISQPQPQPTCPQPQLQPQMRIKPQQQPFSQTFPAGKPVVVCQGYHDYPQGYQPASNNSMHPNRAQAPATLHQNQQPTSPDFEPGQNSEGHCYSPEKTPYMDTVNHKDKTYNTVYSTHGSHEAFLECDTNSQIAGSSVCENDNSAHSQYRPRHIIAMSELEDFMEMSDW